MSIFTPEQRLIIREATAAAAQQALKGKVPTFKPGTVMGFSTDESTAEVAIDADSDPGTVDDDSSSGSTSVGIWYPSSVRAGDRVMVIFYPPNGAAIIGRLKGGYEEWRYPGDEDAPAFSTGWQSASAAGLPFQDLHAAASFRRSGRWVELRGLVQRASGVEPDAWVLPDDYWPMNRVVQPCLISDNTIGYCVVTPTGAVQPRTIAGAAVASPDYMFLDNVAYSVDVFPSEEL